jgi:hypothetical protein
MAPPFYHQHPDTFTLDTQVVGSRPGRECSPFCPGGRGQVADRGTDNKGRHDRRIRIGLEGMAP